MFHLDGRGAGETRSLGQRLRLQRRHEIDQADDG